MLPKNMCVAIIAFLITSASFAQESRSEFSLQGAGFFTRSVISNGTSYSATQTGGLLASYRFTLHRGLSAEIAYGYSRNTQNLSYSSGTFEIPSNNHQFTAALVQALPSFRKAKLSPYLLVGAGAEIFKPVASNTYPQSAASTQAEPAFVYGGGVNYAILKRVSLRFEYRGLVYSAPDMGFSGLKTNGVTHSAQPSVGLNFRF
jgi:outer membrane immunogenic protein